MNKIDEINAIANELANNGQKPSVALVKAKLSQNTPLPTIISTLKSWQHQPNFTRDKLLNEEKPTSEKKESSENDVISTAIEKAIAPLRAELALLKEEIALLKKRK